MRYSAIFVSASKKISCLLILSSLSYGKKGIILEYHPQLGSKTHYALDIQLNQQLDEPTANLSIETEMGIQLEFELSVSSFSGGYIETYTIKSSTIRMNPSIIDFNTKASKWAGKSWSVKISSTGQIISDNAAIWAISPRPFNGKLIKPSEFIQAVSRVRYPILGIIINVESKNAYQLQKIEKKYLCYFTLESKINASTLHPIRQDLMTDSDITGGGTGTFIWDNSKSIITEMNAEFDLGTYVSNNERSSGILKFRMKQHITLSLSLK